MRFYEMMNISYRNALLAKDLSIRVAENRRWLNTSMYLRYPFKPLLNGHYRASHTVLILQTNLNSNYQSVGSLIRIPSKLETHKNSSGNRFLHSTSSKLSVEKRQTKNETNSAIEEANAILTDLKNNADKSSSTLTVQQINECLTDLSKLRGRRRNPNRKQGTSVLNLTQVDIAQLAQRILEQMEHFNNTPNSNMRIYQPDIVTYNIVLNIWAKSDGGHFAAKNADHLLNRMISHYEMYSKQIPNTTDKKHMRKTPPICPNMISFHSVMDAWAKSKTSRSGRKAEELFHRMIQFYENLQKNDKKKHVEEVPNVRSYAIIIDAWANSGEKDAAERASFILDEIVMKTKNDQPHIQQDNEPKIKPNVILLNSVIKVRNLNLSNVILIDILYLCSLHLTIVIFIIYIYMKSFRSKAWTKSGKGGYAAQKAEEILNKMERSFESPSIHTSSGEMDDIYPAPTVRSYSLVLDAWAKSNEKGGALRAETILSKMHKLYDEGHDIKPNRFSYTIVINALARSKEKGTSQRAEDVLDKMIEFQKASDDSLAPGTATFNAVIDAWARSGEKNAGEKAELVLNKLERLSKKTPGLQPDITTFNSVMAAWSRCSKFVEGAVARAEALLLKMEKQDDNLKKILPNTVTCNSLLCTYRQSKLKSSLKKAEGLLEKMEASGTNSDFHIKPNLITYTSMIEVYARIHSKGMAKKAESVFKRIGNRSTKGKAFAGDTKPDIKAFSSLLQACANTRGTASEKREALTIALNAYDLLMKESRLNEGISPNSITYRILLEICGYLTANKIERERLLKESFLRCCNDGQVDRDVLKMFRRAASSELYNKLVEKRSIQSGRSHKNSITIYDLPPEWSVNVRNKRSKIS